MTNDLLKTNDSEIIDTQISADDVLDLTLYAKVFTHATDQTAVQMSKIGDICVLNTGAIYIAKSTTKSTGWVALDVTA
jgi:hypothetical protein